MFRTRLTNLAVGVLIAAGLATNGCTFAPGWGRHSRLDGSGAAQPAASEILGQSEAEAPPIRPEAETERDEGGELASKSAREPSPEDIEPPELKAFIAELEEYPEIELADRNEILQQLHQTEPALLEAVIRQYRANLAFGQQKRKRDLESADTAAASESTQTETSASTPPATPLVAAAEAEAQSPGATSTAVAKPIDEPERPLKTAAPVASIATRGPPPRLPESKGGSAKPAVVPPKLSSAGRQENTDRSSNDNSESQVVAATFEAPAPADWCEQLKVAIETLESSVTQAPDSEEELSDHARLRLLYLAAKRRDEALRPIPTLDSAMTEFWNKEVFGLAALLDAEMIPDPENQTSEAKVHFQEALSRLGDASPLAVRNLAFITKVVSYGVYTPFDVYEFTPGQRVGLYVEIENFTSKEGPQGYRTSLKSSYQILDNLGQRLATQDFVPNHDSCRNRRRDYFFFYEFSLPERIYPGEYTLQLTVTDINSRKVGQARVQFRIEDRND